MPSNGTVSNDGEEDDYTKFNKTLVIPSNFVLAYKNNEFYLEMRNTK